MCAIMERLCPTGALWSYGLGTTGLDSSSFSLLWMMCMLHCVEDYLFLLV
jgi:hypothetical protein